MDAYPFLLKDQLKNVLSSLNLAESERSAVEEWLLRYEAGKIRTYKFTDVPLLVYRAANGLLIVERQPNVDEQYDPILRRAALITNQPFDSEREEPAIPVAEFDPYPMMPALIRAFEPFDQLNDFAEVFALVRLARIDDAAWAGSITAYETRDPVGLLVRQGDSGVAFHETYMHYLSWLVKDIYLHGEDILAAGDDQLLQALNRMLHDNRQDRLAIQSIVQLLSDEAIVVATHPIESMKFQAKQEKARWVHSLLLRARVSEVQREVGREIIRQFDQYRASLLSDSNDVKIRKELTHRHIQMAREARDPTSLIVNSEAIFRILPKDVQRTYREILFRAQELEDEIGRLTKLVEWVEAARLDDDLRNDDLRLALADDDQRREAARLQAVIKAREKEWEQASFFTSLRLWWELRSLRSDLNSALPDIESDSLTRITISLDTRKLLLDEEFHTVIGQAKMIIQAELEARPQFALWWQLNESAEKTIMAAVAN